MSNNFDKLKRNLNTNVSTYNSLPKIQIKLLNQDIYETTQLSLSLSFAHASWNPLSALAQFGKVILIFNA